MMRMDYRHNFGVVCTLEITISTAEWVGYPISRERFWEQACICDTGTCWLEAGR
jgi:hypothetical protein